MPHLPQAAVSRVGHQDMAHHTCSRVPSVSGPVDPVLVAEYRGERFAAVLEDGAGEGGESLAAVAAAPPRDAGAETRAFKVLPIRRAAPVATATQVGGLSEKKELVGDGARHEYPEGVRSSI